jgi:hypothetical protein
MFDGARKLEGAPPVRRVKRYAAASGYVYEYFYMGHRAVRQGTVHVFGVAGASISVVLRQTAIDAWEHGHGRELGAAERYGIVKMALFAAFDESAGPEGLRARVEVADIDPFAEVLGL